MKLSQSSHSMCREQKEETPRMQTETGIDVKNLSDRRLWEILRLAGTDEQRAAAALIAHARDELSARRQDTEARRFHAPR
jgi:hypothetical protein